MCSLGSDVTMNIIIEDAFVDKDKGKVEDKVEDKVEEAEDNTVPESSVVADMD
jgi:hypothetical protein